LRVNNLFQSELSTKCDLVLPLLIQASSRFIKVIQCLLTSFSSSSLTSLFRSKTCFRRQVLSKKWPIQSAFLFFTVCRIFLSSLTLCNTFHFSVDRFSV